MEMQHRGAANRFWLSALVAVLAFLSYHQNFFQVVSAQWFNQHGIFGENLVLDGLLYSDDQSTRTMGIYTDMPVETARSDYAAEKRSRHYAPYYSFYGLQSRVFGAMREHGFGGVAQMQALVATLTSLSVAWVFWLLVRQFGTRLALAMSAVMVLSPWFVVFARNLYWVPCVWLLPLGVALHYAPRIFSHPRSLGLMGVGLYAAFMLRFLCGYDYAPTLVIGCFVPVAYYGLHLGFPARVVLQKLMVVGLVAVAGFASAVAMHAQALERLQVAGTETVWITAQKRLYAITDTPQAIATQVCGADAVCASGLIESLESNPLKVVAGYFVVPYFLPWTQNVAIADADRAALKQFFAGKKTIVGAGQVAHALSAESWVYLLLKILNPVCFFAFLLALGLSLRHAPRAARAACFCALLAPVSWFAIAKAHSYIHEHLNYVLWYVPFVPVALALILAYPPRFSRQGRKGRER